MLRLVRQLSPIALGTRIRARRRHIYARLHGRGTQSNRGTGMSDYDSPRPTSNLVPPGVQQCRPAYPYRTEKADAAVRIHCAESVEDKTPYPLST